MGVLQHNIDFVDTFINLKGDYFVFKKIISLLIVIALVATIFPVAFAASKPTVTVSSCEAEPGDKFTLSVLIENNPGINSFAFGFDYDANKLELLDVNVSKNLGGQFVYKKKAVWLNSKDTKYNGEILELKFKVLDKAQSGDTKVKVTYSPGDICNYNEDDVNCKVVAGTVTIGEQQVKESFFTKIMNFFKRIMSFFKNLFN